MPLFVARSCQLFGLEKFRRLEVPCLWNSHFINVHACVYEEAFEFISWNIYIFKLPLVDDRNTIWFTLVFLRFVSKQASLTIFNSTRPLEINTVWEKRNIKILSVIDYSPSFSGHRARVFTRDVTLVLFLVKRSF